MRIARANKCATTSFDRTYEELKPRRREPPPLPRSDFHRTYEELKLGTLVELKQPNVPVDSLAVFIILKYL